MTLTHSRPTSPSHSLTNAITTSIQRAGLALNVAPSSTPERFNIAPTQSHPVLTMRDPREAICTLSQARWGTPSSRSKRLLVNLRCETLTRRPTWLRNAQRVAVPIDGFYEWIGPRSKRSPLWIHAHPNQPSPILWVAALYEPAPTLDEDATFTILTCPANATVAPIRSRMPVLLREEDLAFWLHPQTPVPLLKSLLQPAHPACLTIDAASTHANKATNDSAACLTPPKTLALSPDELLSMLRGSKTAPNPRAPRSRKTTKRLPRETSVARNTQHKQTSLFDFV